MNIFKLCLWSVHSKHGTPIRKQEVTWKHFERDIHNVQSKRMCPIGGRTIDYALYDSSKTVPLTAYGHALQISKHLGNSQVMCMTME